MGTRVTSIQRDGAGWRVCARGAAPVSASFVFIGAGGGSLALLQGTGIPESRGIGGFPIGGQWLVCNRAEVVAQHRAKVYGQALGAAPTMAVPHLDTRVLDGEHVLLFGPFAAWTAKFLHGGGSHLDLPRSVRSHNALTLARVGAKNLDLIRYLVQQGRQGKQDRMRALREFYPAARSDDWQLMDAGIRVQAIKSSEGKSGIVHYGTEVLTDERGSIAALLGASPGASVSASIALEVVQRCLPSLLRTGALPLGAMAPTWGKDLAHQPELFHEIQRRASRLLQLE
jgi:malate dehydrogenase (quinone)